MCPIKILVPFNTVVFLKAINSNQSTDFCLKNFRKECTLLFISNLVFMGKTISSITMSLDGFIAGENISPDNPMGENGILLHNWIFGDSEATDKKVLSDLIESTGAVILGS